MHPASPSVRSRFLQRWLGADPARPALLDEACRLSLSSVDLGTLLARELDAGLPLPRAMRRLRNLLVCGLIRRDLEGLADLDEVVTAMTRFADFAIRTHTEALGAEWEATMGVRLSWATCSRAVVDICDTSMITPRSFRRCTACLPMGERPPRASGESLKNGSGREESAQLLLPM